MNVRDAVFYGCSCVVLGRLLIITIATRTTLAPKKLSAARPHIHGTTTPASYALTFILFPRGNGPACRPTRATDITTIFATLWPGHILGVQ